MLPLVLHSEELCFVSGSNRGNHDSSALGDDLLDEVMVSVEKFQVLLAVCNMPCLVRICQNVRDELGREFTQLEIFLDDAVDSGNGEASLDGNVLQCHLPILLQKLPDLVDVPRPLLRSSGSLGVSCVSLNVTILEFVEPNSDLSLGERQSTKNIVQFPPDLNGCGTGFLHELDRSTLFHLPFQRYEGHEAQEQEKNPWKHRHVDCRSPAKRLSPN